MFTCRSLMFDAQIHLDKFEDNSIERTVVHPGTKFRFLVGECLVSID